MYENFFRHVPDFFGGHLHQDYDIEGDTIEGVARHCADTWPVTEVRDTIGELCVLAETPGGDYAISALAQQFKIGVNLGFYAPESEAVRGLAREMAGALSARIAREDAPGAPGEFSWAGIRINSAGASLRAASSFATREDAERLVERTIAVNEQQVASWLAQRPTRQRAFYLGDSAEATGKIVKPGSPAVHLARGVKVVLRPDATTPLGYWILTAYPVDQVGCSQAGFFTYTPDFFSAYLHQDFDVHASTPDGVARFFAETTSYDDVRGALGELGVLEQAVGGDKAIANLVLMFGTDVNIGAVDTEATAVRGLAREMAAAFAQRLERERRVEGPGIHRA